MIHFLDRPHQCRYGTPTVDRVDTSIFSLHYFTDCLACTFCHDRCCAHGVDIDIENVARILAQAPGLAQRLSVPPEEWVRGDFKRDSEFSGGEYSRTSVHEGACVFLDRVRRGCIIHRYCVENHIDYHELKPMVSVLFPITFDEGILHPSEEALDGTLICLGTGRPTLYRGVREELEHYFGHRLTSELDALEESLQ